MEDISRFKEYDIARTFEPSFSIYYCHFCTYKSYPGDIVDVGTVTAEETEVPKLERIRSIRDRVAVVATGQNKPTRDKVRVIGETTVLERPGLLRAKTRVTRNEVLAAGWRLAEVRTRTSRSRWDDSYPVDDVLGILVENNGRLSAYQYISAKLAGPPDVEIVVKLDDEHQQSTFTPEIDLRRLYSDHGLSEAAGCRLYRSIDIGFQGVEEGLARLGL